jgi:hypothetical protein
VGRLPAPAAIINRSLKRTWNLRTAERIVVSSSEMFTILFSTFLLK